MVRIVVNDEDGPSLSSDRHRRSPPTVGRTIGAARLLIEVVPSRTCSLDCPSGEELYNP
jgi:hypothetical protein